MSLNKVVYCEESKFPKWEIKVVKSEKTKESKQLGLIWGIEEV